jgi:hypothetical protein
MLLFDTTADDNPSRKLREFELQTFLDLENKKQKNPKLSSKYDLNVSVLADPSIA